MSVKMDEVDPSPTVKTARLSQNVMKVTRVSPKRLRTIVRDMTIIVVLVIILFPVYWMFQSALETQVQIFHNPPYFFPPTPSFAMLGSVFSDVAPALVHSAIIATGCVLI